MCRQIQATCYAACRSWYIHIQNVKQETQTRTCDWGYVPERARFRISTLICLRFIQSMMQAVSRQGKHKTSKLFLKSRHWSKTEWYSKLINFNYKRGWLDFSGCWVLCVIEMTDGADKGRKLKQIPGYTKSQIMKAIKTTVSCIYLYRPV